MLTADILLVDAKNTLWRAAEAHPDLGLTVGGVFHPTGAIYGFLSILTRVHERLGGLVVVCWDDSKEGPAERVAMFADYKKRAITHAGNPLNPDPEKAEFLRAMKKQMKQLMEVLTLAGVRQVYSPRWEADDAMGTLARRLGGNGKTTALYTGDRDLFQCITDDTMVVRPQPKGEIKIETAETVLAEWGVQPTKFVDLKALMGDNGDNIPGCKGIGPKNAAKILAVFDTVDLCLDSLAFWGGSGLSERLRDKLVEHQDDVRLSYRLARINTEAPLTFLPRRANAKRVLDLFVQLRFKSMLQGERYKDLLDMGV